MRKQPKTKVGVVNLARKGEWNSWEKTLIKVTWQNRSEKGLKV